MNDDIDLYQSIYKVLMDAQVPETDIDNHYSDLYVRGDAAEHGTAQAVLRGKWSQ